MNAAAARAHDDPAPDMTSMIDVVFLVIVFFLCLDFRNCEAKVPAYLPCDRSVGPTKFEPVPQLSVQVRVREQGRRVYPDGGAEGHDPWPAGRGASR